MQAKRSFLWTARTAQNAQLHAIKQQNNSPFVEKVRRAPGA